MESLTTLKNHAHEALVLAAALVLAGAAIMAAAGPDPDRLPIWNAGLACLIIAAITLALAIGLYAGRTVLRNSLSSERRTVRRQDALERHVAQVEAQNRELAYKIGDVLLTIQDQLGHRRGA